MYKETYSSATVQDLHLIPFSMKQRTLLYHQYEGKGTIFFCGTKKIGDLVIGDLVRRYLKEN